MTSLPFVPWITSGPSVPVMVQAPQLPAWAAAGSAERNAVTASAARTARARVFTCDVLPVTLAVAGRAKALPWLSRGIGADPTEREVGPGCRPRQVSMPFPAGPGLCET